MNLYIVRHGQVKHNVLKQFSSSDEELNEIGITQACQLQSKFNDIDYDIIFSSPLKRAIQTANIINIKNRDIVIDERLKERNPGDLDGKSFEEEKRIEYWNYNSAIQFGTSENIQDFFDRVFMFIEELKDKNYENVIIVTHSGVAKAFLAYFNGIGNGYFLHKGLKNCEVKEYKIIAKK